MDKEILNLINKVLFKNNSNLEKDILEYLKKNFYDLPSISLFHIADNCYCSTTSVTRVIKKLGFSNYKDLQHKLIQNNNDSMLDNKNFKEEILNFVNVLCKSDCIYIYGKGSSYLASLYFFRMLIKYGINASLMHEEDLLYSLESRTVVLVSNSGKTNSINKFAKELKLYNNCQILSITKKESLLEKNSDFTIYHDHTIQNNRDNPAAIISTINEAVEAIQYIKK